MSSRITTVVAFVAILAAVLLLRDPAEREPPASGASAPSSPPITVSTETFCAAFDRVAVTHANHLTNDTAASKGELQAATRALLELEPGTTMPPQARAGLSDTARDLLGEPRTEPDPDALEAFNAFVTLSCR